MMAELDLPTSLPNSDPKLVHFGAVAEMLADSGTVMVRALKPELAALTRTFEDTDSGRAEGWAYLQALERAATPAPPSIDSKAPAAAGASTQSVPLPWQGTSVPTPGQDASADGPLTPPSESSTVQAAGGPRTTWPRAHFVGLRIGGGIAAVIGLLAVLLVGNDASVCSSGLGQFAQSVSNQAARSCAIYSGSAI